jgi:O-antigen/teichoic acid export membrane protein
LNPLKQLAGQTAIYGLSSVLARILNFLLVPFYTRIFVDTAEYGIINELYAYVAFIIIILTYGMETAFFRFSSRHNGSPIVYSTSLISVLATSVLFVVVIIIFHPFLASITGYADYSVFILLLGLVLAFDAAAALPFARLRLQNQALRFALIKLFNICMNIFFNLFFLVFLPWLTDSRFSLPFLEALYIPELRVGYVFLSNLLASFLTLLFFVRDFSSHLSGYSFGLFRKMIAYSFPLLIAGLAGTVNEVIDRIMLRHRLPEGVNALEEIGIYGANIKIAVLMTLFIQMFRYAFEPFIFSQEKSQNNRELYARVMNYFTIFGILVFLGITLYIDIFQHIIGPEYREGLRIVPIVLFGNLMLGIYFNLSVWYKLGGATIFGALFAVTGALITIAINYYFIPGFGYMASAWAHFIAYSSMVIMSYIAGRYYYPVPYNLKKLLLYMLSGLLLYFIASSFKIEDIFYRLSFNTLLILIFAIIVFIIERKDIRNVFQGTAER